MKKLIVVDMQNDFLLPGGKLSISSPDVDTTKELRQGVGEFAKNFDGRVICTADSHELDDPEFKQFPPHCIKDTEGAELCDEVKNALGSLDKTVTKLTFNSDGIPVMVMPYYIYKAKEEVLTPFEIHIVGVCTHICVHDIASQIANTYKERWGVLADITIHRDLCGDFDPEMAEMCLKRLQNLYGVKVV